MRTFLALAAVLVLAGSTEAGWRHRRSTIQPSCSSVAVAQAVQTQAVAVDGGDALAVVNAQRAARGLRPFIRDIALETAARSAAAFRASRLLFGHTTGGAGDFAFLPSGATAAAAGCAAYPASYGFMACAVYENYTFAGAASVQGPDGRMYHHIFVK